MPERELLSIRAYARHRADLKLPGGSHTAVLKAIATQRLDKGLVIVADRRTPMIDPAIADAEWNDRTDPAQSRGPDQSGGPIDGGAGGVEDPRPPDGGPPGVMAQLRMAQLAKCTYQAKIAELEARKMAGEQIDAPGAGYEAQRQARALRDSILAVPAIWAPQLAAEVDVERCRRLLDSVLRQALADRSEAAKRELEALDEEGPPA